MNKILNSLIKIYFIKSIVAGILIGMAGIISAQYNHPEIIFPVADLLSSKSLEPRTSVLIE